MPRHGCVQKENTLTRLRPQGKYPHTLRPVSRYHGELRPDAQRPGIRRPNAWCHGVLRPDAWRPGIWRPNAWCQGVLRPNSQYLCVSRWDRYVPCQGMSRAFRASGASGRSLCVRMQIFFPDAFKNGTCTIINHFGNNPISATLNRGLYILPRHGSAYYTPSTTNIRKSDSIEVWHQRLEHLNYTDLKLILDSDKKIKGQTVWEIPGLSEPVLKQNNNT